MIIFDKRKHPSAAASGRSGRRRLVLWMLAFSVLLRALVAEAQQSLLQNGIAGEVLRFHVIAASDGERDQRVKLLVRDEILAWLEDAMGKTEAAENKKEQKEEMAEFLAEHTQEAQERANRVLEREDVPYRAQAELETCYFPERTYGSCTFPPGWYTAFCIRLGEAKGRNWWCVLYPKLCFLDCLHPVVDDGALGQLKETLTAEEYDCLLQEPSGWKLAFQWF